MDFFVIGGWITIMVTWTSALFDPISIALEMTDSSAIKI